MDTDGDGGLDIQEFHHFCMSNPAFLRLTHPIQNHLRKCIFGIEFWVLKTRKIKFSKATGLDALTLPHRINRPSEYYTLNHIKDPVIDQHGNPLKTAGHARGHRDDVTSPPAITPRTNFASPRSGISGLTSPRMSAQASSVGMVTARSNVESVGPGPEEGQHGGDGDDDDENHNAASIEFFKGQIQREKSQAILVEKAEDAELRSTIAYLGAFAMEKYVYSLTHHCV